MNRLPRLSPASLEAELRARAEAFARAARRVRETRDEEAIHDLRVSARRLAATLKLWGHVLDAAPRRRALRGCRRLRRRLGRGREHEVHAGMLTQRMTAADVTMRIAASSLLDRLRKKRDRSRRRAAQRVNPHRIQKILVHVAAAHTVHGRQGTPGQDALRLAIARCTERERRGREAITHAIGEPRDRLLHEARIAIKKWRYALEALQFVRSSGVTESPVHHRSPGRLTILRKIQEALGEARDASTLLAVLGKEMRRLERRGLDENTAVLHVLVAGIDRERAEAVGRFRLLAEELSKTSASPSPASLLLRIPAPESQVSTPGA